MKLLFENWRRYLTEAGPPIKIGLKMKPEWEGNWKDQKVAVVTTDAGDVDADITSVGVKPYAQNFVLLLDKLAEYLEVPEPVITSGYRDAAAQRGPMLYIWQSNGGQADAQKELRPAGTRNRR